MARVTSGISLRSLACGDLSTAEDFFQTRPSRANDRVAILSYGLWLRRFGADPTLVGRSVQVNGFPYTVVGILPADFRAPGALAFGERVELWRPLVPEDNQTGGRESRKLSRRRASAAGRIAHKCASGARGDRQGAGTDISGNQQGMECHTRGFAGAGIIPY